MEQLMIKSAQGDYPVNFYDSLEKLIADVAAVPKAVVAVDRIVAGLYREQLKPIYDRLPVLEVDATEDEKTLDGSAKVCNWLQKLDATKQTILIAIGGGIIQDICAFAAHIYYRGLKCYLVPTTLLSMSDSCIGAKCCINFNTYKNQLGVFHSPASVFLCSQFVQTLCDRDVASGYGEILKLMFTGSREHFLHLADVVNAGGLRNGQLNSLIRQSLEVKKKVIEVDEYEKNLRRILNYGHTFGHALETVTEHGVPHGLAVAWGMDLINFMALRKGMLSEADFELMRGFVRKHLPFTMSKRVTAGDIIGVSRRDKKVADGQINLVLPAGPGDLRVVKTRFDGELEALVDEYVRCQSIYPMPQA